MGGEFGTDLIQDTLWLENVAMHEYPSAQMEILFHWTESDYVAARIARLLRHPGKFVLGQVELLIFLGFCVVAMVVKPTDWRIGLNDALLFLGVAIPGLLWSRWRLHKKFMKLPLADTDIVATIDGRGITISAKGQQKTHWWAGFSQIYESSRVVVLENGGTEFLLVPKRAMSVAQLDELRRLAVSAPNCKVRLWNPLG